MKVTINVDCTPEEARVFLGLPDVQPMQRALMAQLQERMSQNLAAMDPETMIKTWLPLGMQNLEQMQRFFWAQMGRNPPTGSGGESESGGGAGKSGKPGKSAGSGDEKK